MDIIDIQNLKVHHGKTQVFDGLNLKIKKGSFVTLTGMNGSGKSTLLNTIMGLNKFDGTILINKEKLKYDKFDDKVKLVSLECFSKGSWTVKRIIKYSLKNKEIDNLKKDILVLKISKRLGIDGVLKLKYENISVETKILVLFAAAIINKPDILLLDNCFSFLKNTSKQIVFHMIKQLQKKGMTILSATNNIEESLYGEEVVILKDGNVLKHDLKEKIFSDYKLFEEINLELPFIVSLSNKLQFYNLVSNTYFDMEQLVDSLWE